MKDAAAGNGAAFNNALQDSSFVQRIDPRLAQPYLDGFSQAMSTVFLVATFILLIAFVVSFLLPHVELRASSAYNERAGNGTPADGASGGRPVGRRSGRRRAGRREVDGSDGSAESEESHDDRKRGRHRAEPGEKLH